MRLYRKTQRLAVRPLRVADFDAWEAAHASMAPMKNRWDWVPLKPSERTRAAFRRLLRKQEKDRRADVYYDLGVFLSSGSLIGWTALMDLSRRVFQNAYLGYRIFNPHWGNGYATESIRATIDIAFVDLGLHRLEAGIEPQNRRSVRVANSLGFRKEGSSKRRLHLRGGWVDIANYALTTEDAGYPWKKLR